MTNSQLSFFQDDPPSGLAYLPEYLTAQQSAHLVTNVDSTPWLTGLKRRVQHFGYRYDYKARRASKDDYLGPLPEWLAVIAENMLRDRYFSAVPEQVIVNEYLPGQGISAHIDCVPCFGEEITSISLLSGCIMRFAARSSAKVFDKYLEPNSLVLLRGAARYDWSHQIPARKSDVVDGQRLQRSRRISLTFRSMVL